MNSLGLATVCFTSLIGWKLLLELVLRGDAHLCRCNTYSLILSLSGFSKHSSFLVSANFFFFFFSGEEYNLPGDVSKGKVKGMSVQSKWLYWCGHLRAVFCSGVDTETSTRIQHCSRDSSSAGVCFGLGWFTMWCICKQDMPKLEPFICLPFPSLKCITFSYNGALIKTSSVFCSFLVRRVEEQDESLPFPILYLTLVMFFVGWLCFAGWNLKGRVDFSVPGAGRTVPGRSDLVVDMAAESCSIAA